MINRKLLLSVVLIFGMSSLFAQKDEAQKEDKGYKFTDVKTIPVTSVKNQYRSGTCWSFSGLAFMEAEMLRKGKDDVDLSEMFVVHHSYYDKSLKYVRMHGTINYGGGGAFNDVTDVMRKYGMMPEEVYTGLQYDEPKHVHGEMDALLDAMVNSIIMNKNKKLTKVWPKAIDGVLNAYLGPIPENFDYKGKNYTSKTFMTDYMDINPDNYVMITSYTHHPFYEPFALEVQDNWAYGQVYNLPLDEFMQVIDANIEAGYTIAWAADVSEKGFSWKNGVAVVPEEEIKSMNDLEQSKWEKLSKKELKKQLYSFDEPHTEKKITQEVRQAAFDNYETTDDHGMLIMGTAKDQNGTLYYKIKNSWSTDQKYDGYFYASKAFVEYKTMSILVNKEAIPKAMRKKLGL
ncbi:MAG: aminopeptidase [Bacteroidetes bacterium]|nr:MAG: aminopeptidase [Bacteroidota bacterium]